MIRANLVLLLVAALAYVSKAQFFGGSDLYSQAHFGGQPHSGQSYFQNSQNLFQLPQLLTCIGTNEALDQLRITLRPERSSSSFSSPAFQYGSASVSRELQRVDWRVSAVYIPAASQGIVSPAATSSLVGSFFIAVTRYGRTEGNCAGQGGILQSDDLLQTSQSSQLGNSLYSPFGGNPYLGGGAGYGHGGLFGGSYGGGAFSPFGLSSHSQGYGHFGSSLFGQQGQYGTSSLFGHQNHYGGSQTPPGFIQDPIVISQGGNVYSAVVRSVSEADLRGRGMAICLDYLCQRTTTTCCTIAKDSQAATDTVGALPTGRPIGGGLQGGGFSLDDNGLGL